MTNIKLSAFRIQNYRSIVDTNWCQLSNDNITVLIGQNESGKTSVLEALQCFYDELLDEDVLRSDNTLPIVSCRFTITNNKTVYDLLNPRMIPSDLKEILKSETEISITRKWFKDKTSELYLSETKAYDYFDSILKNDNNIKKQTENAIELLLKESESLLNTTAVAEEEVMEAQKILTEKRKDRDTKQKLFKKARKSDQQVIAEKEYQFAEKQYAEQEESFKNKLELFEGLKIKAEQLSESISVGNAYKFHNDKLKVLNTQIEKCLLDISEYEHLFQLSSNEKDKANATKKLETTCQNLAVLKEEVAAEQKMANLTLLIATKVLNQNINIKQAEVEAKRELKDKAFFYTINSIAKELFKYIPVFEFFEDFSGLLPNKIDLEDILNNKTHVEGYKAAKNFLKIAGFDSNFFRETNQRILKQRIETLNSDVTINFQDYWSQNVGKDNKIRLHFELEHYDYTVPDKSGKPYIEFWIKDRSERLYPKQRSRGVRWFLSFYLELKATAVENQRHRVLLIDEPGLSLHARAQEDVLKVFEDLREKVQIIYCTHSPHLVDTNKLYRVLAVQRADEEDDKSETTIFDSAFLSKASADTLTPIYTLMGVKLAGQQFIHPQKNIIVQDSITYYYLYWLAKLFPELGNIHFIPAADTDSIHVLVNIFSGWEINFGVILFGNESKSIYQKILDYSIKGEDKIAQSISFRKEFSQIEDVFSALDFKKYVLEQRLGITEKNSEYIMLNDLSRKILATNFVNNFDSKKITLKTLDEISLKNINNIFSDIKKILEI